MILSYRVGTCVAKTSNSPKPKRNKKAYRFFMQNAVKQNIAPKNVAPESSCKINNGRKGTFVKKLKRTYELIDRQINTLE